MPVKSLTCNGRLLRKISSKFWSLDVYHLIIWDGALAFCGHKPRVMKNCVKPAGISRKLPESSHVVVILAKIAAVEPGIDYVQNIFGRRGLPADAQQAYLERYAAHNAYEIQPYMNTFAWSSKQCYLALANMMTGAASLGLIPARLKVFPSQQCYWRLIRSNTVWWQR